MELMRYAPRGATGVLRPLDRATAALDLAAAWALVVLVAVMVAVVSAQVALRYLFNNSISWADEVSRLCFVWSMFIAIPLGLKSGAHIGVDMLVARLPRPARARARAAHRGGRAGAAAAGGMGVVPDRLRPVG